jgi:hypothetical protein
MSFPKTEFTHGFGASQPLAGGLGVTFRDVPHRQWLYDLDFVRGDITLLAAPGGVGKSSLAIAKSVAAATGRALLKESVWNGPLTILYINAEDSAVEMHRRIWAFCLHHGIVEQDLRRFLLLGADDWRVQRLSFLHTEKGSSQLNEMSLQHLADLLDVTRPDLLVLDPLVALCSGGNLNDNAAMALVMRALKRLANKFNCAILVLHHTRKGGDLGTADAIGGASAIVNLARRALMAVPMNSEEAPALGVLPSERFAYFKVASSKSNLAPRSDDTPWYKLCSVTLPNQEPPIYMSGDGVQAVERVYLPRNNSQHSADDQKIRRAVFDLVARGKLIGGQFVPYSPAISGAKNERALIYDAIEAAKAATLPRTWHETDIRAVTLRAINALKADRALVEQEIKTGRFRRRRGLDVDLSRAPGGNECSPIDVLAGSEEPTTGALAPLPAGGGQSVIEMVDE